MCTSCPSSQHSSAWATLSRAAAKKAASVFRAFGTTPTHPRWQARAEICARCPVAHSEGRGLYCGKPLLQQLQRAPHEGCGCPVSAKAKDPAEHCPVDRVLSARSGEGPACNCKWCTAGLGPR